MRKKLATDFTDSKAKKPISTTDFASGLTVGLIYVKLGLNYGLNAPGIRAGLCLPHAQLDVELMSLRPPSQPTQILALILGDDLGEALAG